MRESAPEPQPRVGAVIFDMDGLLIDTEPVWRRAEMQVFGRVGLQLTEEQCFETMGIRIAEVVDRWYSRFPWVGPSPADVTRAIEDEVVCYVEERGVPNPGAREAVRMVHRAGLPVAIASSSSERLIRAVLRRLRLQPFVAVVCSADAEHEGKPHPAVYLSAARRLGLPPCECLALEDSPNGVLSARNAGMLCIAVPDARLRDDPSFQLANLRLDSLRDFTPGLLDGVRLLSGAEG